MSPTGRAAACLAALAAAALLLPLTVVVLGVLALAAATGVDARAAARRPRIERRRPAVLARGVPARLEVDADAAGRRAPRLRQAAPPDLAIAPREGAGALRSELVGRRRGRHALPGVAARVEGPLGLAAWYHRGTPDEEVLVFPDLPAARRLALAVRQGRFRDAGTLTRGALGLGTEFESIRDYSPDDDIRQVNWLAGERAGRPMSNVFRLEQDRDVVCVVDAGRLMAAPVSAAAGRPADRTRLDAAIDAAAAIALVADELGDRCGTIAFDDAIRRRVRPRHRGADEVVRALFDVEPRAVDSDFELAFRHVDGGKRALVVVLCDLLEEAAARPLLEAVPILARRHHVVVASCADEDLIALTSAEPRDAADVYAAAVALDVLAARRRVIALLRGAGADVVEAPAGALAAACVGAYLRAKRAACA